MSYDILGMSMNCEGECIVCMEGSLSPRRIDAPDAYPLVLSGEAYRITKSIKSLKEEANARRRKKGVAEWAYENLGWQVILMNHTVSFQNNRAGFKLVGDCLVGVERLARLPQGLCVYEPPPALDFGRNLEVLDNLFSFVEEKGDEARALHPKYGRFKMRVRGRNNVLFDDDDTRDFRLNLESLGVFDRGLRDFILGCGEYCMEIMGLPKERLGECQLHIVHYLPGGGIPPHIDAVHTQGGTLGPVFVFNMDQRRKEFDMLPTIDREGTPFRLFTTQGQCTVMDGVSRLLWSHAVPEELDSHRYSVAYKFPEMQRLDVIHSDYFHVDIPVNVI